MVSMFDKIKCKRCNKFIIKSLFEQHKLSHRKPRKLKGHGLRVRRSEKKAPMTYTCSHGTFMGRSIGGHQVRCKEHLDIFVCKMCKKQLITMSECKCNMKTYKPHCNCCHVPAVTAYNDSKDMALCTICRNPNQSVSTCERINEPHCPSCCSIHSQPASTKGMGQCEVCCKWSSSISKCSIVNKPHCMSCCVNHLSNLVPKNPDSRELEMKQAEVLLKHLDTSISFHALELEKARKKKGAFLAMLAKVIEDTKKPVPLGT